MWHQMWKTGAIVATVAFLCYINSLEGEFVYDDSRAILKNDDLLPTTPWPNLLVNDFWGTPLNHSGSHRSYRPICVASFRLNYYISGHNPWSYHLVNVFLHCAVSILLVVIADIIFKENIPTFLAGVLFAVHPIHTEAVSGVVGRADVAACFFYLASWLAYHKGCCSLRHEDRPGQTTSWFWTILSMIFVTFSMLSKEQGITVIGVCCLYDALVVSRIRFTNFALSFEQAKQNGFLKRMCVLLLTGFTLFAMRLWLMGNSPPQFSPADNPAANSDSFKTRTLTFLLLPAKNFWLLVFPHTLCFDWSMKSVPLVKELGDIRNAFSLVFYTSTVLLLALCLKGLENAANNSSTSRPQTTVIAQGSISRKISAKHFGLRNRKFVRKTNNSNKLETSNNHTVRARTNINTTTATSSTINNSPNFSYPIATNDTLRKEQRITLNSYERAIVSVGFLVLPFIPATNLFFYVGFVIAERILYIPSVGFSLLVAHIFSISWKATGKFLRVLLAGTTCAYLILLSARTIRRNLDWRTDETLYRSGILVNPSKAWSNLGNVLKSRGNFPEAEHAYKKSLEDRSSADTWYNLGLLYQGEQRFRESIECYQNAITLRSQFVLPYLNQGLVLESMGEKENAVTMLAQATEVDGTGLKDPKQHDYGVAAAKFHRGRILAEMSRFDEAIDVFKDAIQTRPDHFPAHGLFNLLGEALSGKGETTQADVWYLKALEVKPDHIPAFLAYARMLSKQGRVKEAEETYTQSLKLAPNNTDVYMHYAKHLSRHGNDVDAARMSGEAAELSPENYDIVATTADAFRKIKDYAHALRLYKRAAELRPKLPSAQMNLGAMYHLIGEYEQAEKYYLKTLELAPNEGTALGNLKKLQNQVKERSKTND